MIPSMTDRGSRVEIQAPSRIASAGWHFRRPAVSRGALVRGHWQVLVCQCSAITLAAQSCRQWHPAQFGPDCTDFQYFWFNSRTDFQAKIPSEPGAWYRNSEMRSFFETYCRLSGHDPKMYYPNGVVPRIFDLRVGPDDVFRLD